MRNHFPEYAKLYSGAGVIGVPGFWQDDCTVLHIWKPRNYLMPILVIPYKDRRGLIQACQIRLHARDISVGGKKYRWLASPLERRGTSSGTPIHFTFAPETLRAGETVVITEGALKAETLISFRPKARVIATAGVSCSHDQIIEAHENPHPYGLPICLENANLVSTETNSIVLQLFCMNWCSATMEKRSSAVPN